MLNNGLNGVVDFSAVTSPNINGISYLCHGTLGQLRFSCVSPDLRWAPLAWTGHSSNLHVSFIWRLRLGTNGYLGHPSLMEGGQNARQEVKRYNAS